MKKYLITTPDYPPKIGGLSTFTLFLEETFKVLGLNYEIYNWENAKKLSKTPESFFADFDLLFNVHPYLPYFFPNLSKKSINFIHGSEILWRSPNFIKNILKR